VRLVSRARPQEYLSDISFSLSFSLTEFSLLFHEQMICFNLAYGKKKGTVKKKKDGKRVGANQ
jgi:hypothetical protein